MRKTYQIAGAVLLAIALFFGTFAARLPYMTPIGPGPGFFPIWLCGLLAVLSLAMIGRATLGEPEKMPSGFFPEAGGNRDIAIAVVALLAAAVLLESAGFSLVMLIFYVVLLVAFGRRQPVEIAILSIIGSFGVEYVFSQILSQPLPVGLLGG